MRTNTVTIRSRLRGVVKSGLLRIVRIVVGEELDRLKATSNRLDSELRLQRARLELHERYQTLYEAAHRKDPPQQQGQPTHFEDQTLEKSLASLRRIAPNAYVEWREVSKIGAHAYLGFPTDSCSVKGHVLADLFLWFLKPLLEGRVLDIGCGPQPVPRYLEGYPLDFVFGIDPLSSNKDHPFFFIQGVGEFLPWDDRSFETVVAATSLDHVLLPDRALQEIRRVLKDNGHFVAWVSFVKGAEKYDPYSPDIKKTDQYHLFHFDRGWFEQTVEKFFTIEEAFDCPTPYNSTFYNLRPR